jgi:hypothetical protein
MGPHSQWVGRFHLDGFGRDTFGSREGTAAVSVSKPEGHAYHDPQEGGTVSIVWSFYFQQWFEGVPFTSKRGSVL